LVSGLLLLANYFQNVKAKRLSRQSEEIQKQVDEKTLELSQKNENLIKANELNNDLFDIIGHDLRSPITSLTNITKSLEYLSRNGTPEETAKLGKSVEDNAKNLLTTVDKLIRWSKLKRDSKIVLERVEICKLLKEILFTYDSSIKSKKLSIDTDGVDKNMTTQTDYGSLRSILKNIISNAIKFSDSHSTITISASQSKQQTILKICDQGIGITEEQIKSIFSNEFIVSSQGLSGEEGLGIGLKNSIKLLDKLGSRINFNPNQPKGTVVEIILEQNLPRELVHISK